jgi:hypothetical protein
MTMSDPLVVMAGLVPAIHVAAAIRSSPPKAWITGTSPVMTIPNDGERPAPTTGCIELANRVSSPIAAIGASITVPTGTRIPEE